MKRLSFRFVRRAFLILALLFPIVYLTGSLFFTLNGSNGSQLLSEDSYVYEWKETEVSSYSDLVEGKTYRFYFDSPDLPSTSGSFTYTLQFGLSIDMDTLSLSYMYNTFEISSGRITLYKGSNSSAPNVIYDSSFSGGWAYSFRSIYLYRNGTSYLFGSTVFNNMISMATTYVAVETTTITTTTSYSDYLFASPFAKNNFISDLGMGVIQQSAPGFEPFRDMLYWFNANMLLVNVDDGLGCFGLGYCYYALNVIAIYELVVLVVMVFTLPLKLTDRFTKEM